MVQIADIEKCDREIQNDQNGAEDEKKQAGNDADRKVIAELDKQIAKDKEVHEKLKRLRKLFERAENVQIHYRIYAQTDTKTGLKVPLYTTEAE